MSRIFSVLIVSIYSLTCNDLLIISSVKCSKITIPDLGTFIGKRISNNTTGFLGIKYASVKGRRFKFAEPVMWSDNKEYDATEYQKPCPNLEDNTRNKKELKDEIDEDCLFLNIYTRNISPEANQTVILFVHDGNFHNGVENVNPLNFLENDLVFVAVQYRLGPLGFLSTETEDIPGNVGFIDVVFALEWVCNFIKHFGGKRESVTIFGHGSGAAIASALMYWNRPSIWSDHFQRVILLSGSYFSPWAFDWHPKENAKELATFLNCEKNPIDIKDVNKCLQEADLKDLLVAYQNQLDKNRNLGLTAQSRLTVNEQLPSPYNIIQPNTPKSLLVGVTKDNGINILDDAYDIFIKDSLTNDKVQFFDLINNLVQFLGINDYTGSLVGILKAYLFSDVNVESFVDLIPGLIDIAGALTIKAPILKDIQLSGKSKINSNYLFTFDYNGKLSKSIWLNGTLKKSFVGHGDEMKLIFPLNICDLDKESKMISQTLADLLTSFAKTGVPKLNGLKTFPRATEFAGPYVHIDADNSIGKDFLDEFSITSRKANGSNHLRTAYNHLLVLSMILMYIIPMF